MFSEIRDELVSPSLIAWMGDFLTALIEFLMSSYTLLGGYLVFYLGLLYSGLSFA